MYSNTIDYILACRELAECREQIKEGKEQLDRQQEVHLQLEQQCQARDNRIQELEKTIKSNEIMINLLNKQVSGEITFRLVSLLDIYEGWEACWRD